MWELSQARRCHWRAVRLWTAVRFAAAQADGVRAVELFERRQERDPGADPAELVAALLTLAGFHGELASHGRAERFYHRAVAVLTGGAAGWVQAPIMVEVLIRLGNGQRLQGQYTAAEATLRKVTGSADRAEPTPELLGAAHSALGMVCKDTGRYEEAGRRYATALDLLACAGPGARVCLHHNLAGLAHAQGRFAEAEGPARRAVACATKPATSRPPT
jgi:tetratricopeptide (TPR) repeat protein